MHVLSLRLRTTPPAAQPAAPRNQSRFPYPRHPAPPTLPSDPEAAGVRGDMSVLNATLSLADFYKLRKSDQAGFAKWRIETLPAGMLLFKLTKGDAPEGQYGVSPWWSAVKPFKEDDEGALGRFQQAQLNGITMSAMVRYMSAVRVDWNDLDNYVQVQLLVEAKCFWGTFSAQPKWSQPNYNLADIRARKDQERRVSGNAMLPDVLGVLEAWQIFLPNLKNEHIRRYDIVPAHDMAALAMSLGA